MLFNVVPTSLEILLVSGIMTVQCGPSYALVTLGTLGVYSTYTILVTSWRTKIRKQMNASENEASSKAIDALMNYETVKYCNNEMHETMRYDESLSKYQKAAQRTLTSLSMLNFGQNAIFSVGLTSIMYVVFFFFFSEHVSNGHTLNIIKSLKRKHRYMAACEITAGTMTVGDLVREVSFLSLRVYVCVYTETHIHSLQSSTSTHTTNVFTFLRYL